MTKDTYKGFAERYDLFHKSFDQQNPDRVEFFRKVFADNHVRSVLDCACGTGRDLILFHSLGLEVFGSDISESMLAVARKNLAEHDADIPVEEVDYRDLPRHYDRQFDAVMCLASSILEMADSTHVLRAFRSMRDVLTDHGILVLTQGTADKMWAEKPRFIPAVTRPDFSRIFVIDYTEKGARFNVLDIFHTEDRSELKVWTKDYNRILLRDDHKNLLSAAGFTNIVFYGSYRFDAYDRASSDMLISIAKK
jgi:glycine/sarcosine N-methyltransferase